MIDPSGRDMFSNVLIGVKEGTDPTPLVDIARSAISETATVHLATFLRAGTGEDERQRLTKADRHLEGVAAELRSESVEVTWEVGLIVAAAAADILRVAAQREAELLVIGLAKRSRVGKALMGSDAQRILLGASCPVLVTRTALR